MHEIVGVYETADEAMNVKRSIESENLDGAWSNYFCKMDLVKVQSFLIINK
jgi:hypothetical protein